MAPPNPSQSFRTQPIQRFRLLETSHLHPSVQTELPRSAWSIPRRYYKGQLHFVPSEGFCLDCFETCTIGSDQAFMALGPQPFHRGTQKPISEPTIQLAKQKPNLKDFTCMKVIRCYEWVHCTTWLEIGFQRGFGQWLQLMHCANLLAVGLSISIINFHKFGT